MVCGAPSAEDTEHCKGQYAATANDQWKKHGKNGPAGVGFMGARQSDAVANERPNATNQPTANRYDLQRTSGALGKSEDAESSFK